MKLTVSQLRQIIREEVSHVMAGAGVGGGWDAREDYDVNRWADLQRMLPGMESELARALERIRVEAPKIRRVGARYTIDGLTNEIVGSLGVPPEGRARQAIRDVVHHLARL